MQLSEYSSLKKQSEVKWPTRGQHYSFPNRSTGSLYHTTASGTKDLRSEDLNRKGSSLWVDT
jgi:hypothetical protein